MHISYDPFLIIVSSPSGAGKTTLCNKITEGDDSIKMSVSTTTRIKRSNEIDGQDYYFVTDDQFEKLKQSNSFLESAMVFGNKYGTLKKSVNDIINNNNSVLFDIDWQGARQIKKNFDQKKIISIFILPPSIDELERRLKNRAQDSLETMQNRMQKAINEIDHFNEYDYVLINDDINQTFKDISSIIAAKKIFLRKDKEINNLIKKFF